MLTGTRRAGRALLVTQSVKILQCRRPGFDPWVGKIPWRKKWLPTPVFWSGEFRGQRSLAGYSLWGLKRLDTTERLSLSFGIDWFDFLAVQGTLGSSPAPQFESIDSSALSLLYGPTLTSSSHWEDQSFDYTAFCWQSDVSGGSCILLYLFPVDGHVGLQCPAALSKAAGPSNVCLVDVFPSLLGMCTGEELLSGCSCRTTDFQCGWNIGSCVRTLFAPHPYQYLVLSGFHSADLQTF